ncbi:uncharacterized protein LOC126838673 [Adelges cooleyi]|uniref:uncharacterized protein LOC126838673 n=1 Tax=Adelges cooleyi TaxID=133065 RepID=UPI0021806643|nr:uncharacterized protein LOC126838673 [Adelges cooleyi]
MKKSTILFVFFIMMELALVTQGRPYPSEKNEDTKKLLSADKKLKHSVVVDVGCSTFKFGLGGKSSSEEKSKEKALNRTQSRAGKIVSAAAEKSCIGPTPTKED